MLLPGMYIAADSILHRLDPRVKLGAALLLMGLPFAVHSLTSYLLLAALAAGAALLSTAPLAALLRTLRTVFWLGLFMAFFYFFTTPGTPLVALSGITLTGEGLLAGVTQVYRLCLLVTIAALLTFTTSSTQLAHGLEALLGPLQRVGLPVSELIMVLTIALRFVPTFFEEIEKIGRAQRARGADLQSGSPVRRARSAVALFIPLLVSAFRHAEELATAMEARGFRGARQRSRLVQLRLGRHDLVATLAVLAASLVILALGRF